MPKATVSEILAITGFRTALLRKIRLDNQAETIRLRRT